VSASGNIANIGFIGTGEWSVIFLKELLDHPRCRLETVLTTQYSPVEVRQRRLDMLNPVYFKSADDYSLLTRNQTDAIIMAGWPYKIPAKVIESIECPIINIHGSLLPRYRGPEPIVHMLLHDEKEGGVTLYKIDSEWDAGPICVQAGFTISPSDNNRTLFFKAARTGRILLQQVIEKILRGNLMFIPQNHAESSYHPKLKIEDYILTESKTIHDTILIARAFTGQYPLLGKANNTVYLIKKFRIVTSLLVGQPGITLQDGCILLEEYEVLDGIPRIEF
jgi:methionyl-tRNA formyltransferase